MPDDFVVARNPDQDSSLPYLLRVPLGPDGVLLKAKETWPRTGKVYCHRADGWPDEAEIVERVPVRSCVRRGAAIDLVLDRGRENRSQLVITRIRGGREAIFWQTARTAKQARPMVTVPTARAQGIAELEVVVDTKERYPYTFKDQQVTIRGGSLAAGDYAVVVDDAVLAAVERKSLDDLVTSLTSGKLRYQLADLSALPRAAVVVEDRYSQLFQRRHVRPSVLADDLAECQVRWPEVPIVFCETRALAQEWTYRFLAAALSVGRLDREAKQVVDAWTPGPAVPPQAPRAAEVRAWAAEHGVEVSDRGRIPAGVMDAYLAAHR